MTRLQQAHDLSLTHIQATISAYSAAEILVEALRRSGRKLDRTVLTKTLEQFDHFETGLTPRISFSGNQHIGIQGIHVVRFGTDRSSGRLDSRWVKLEF